jgi:hypothetical protein
VVIMIKALIAMTAAEEPANIVDAKRDQLLELQELQSVLHLPPTALRSLLTDCYLATAMPLLTHLPVLCATLCCCGWNALACTLSQF